MCNRTGTVGQLRRPGFDFVKGCGGSADSCIESLYQRVDGELNLAQSGEDFRVVGIQAGASIVVEILPAIR